jgi:hypothetical protein
MPRCSSDTIGTVRCDNSPDLANVELQGQIGIQTALGVLPLLLGQ